MYLSHFTPAAVLAASLLLPTAVEEAPQPFLCPVTQPAAFVRPPGFPEFTSSTFAHGSPRLWVQISRDGWHSLRQKIVWFAEDYAWAPGNPAPPLNISGQRLDAPAPPLLPDDVGNGSYRNDMGSFIMPAVNLPTKGCWEITGSLNDESVTFVVLVQ